MTTAPPTASQRTIVDKAWEAQDRIESRMSGVGRGKYGRVLRMARKPTPEEFRKTSTVAAIGIALLGVIGFTIFYIMSFIPQQ